MMDKMFHHDSLGEGRQVMFKVNTGEDGKVRERKGV